MNICFVFLPIEPYSPRHAGAFSTSTAALARELETQGHRVTVVAAQQGLPAYETGTVIDTSIAPRKTRLQRRLVAWWDTKSGYDWHDHARYLRRLAYAIDDVDPHPDVIVVGNDAQVGLRLSEQVSAPFVLWQMNELVTRHPRIQSAADVYRGAIVISDFVGEQVARVTGLPSSSVLTVHGGVDLYTFQPRQHWELTPPEPEILLFGRLDPNKGYHLVLESLLRLRARGSSCRVSLAIAPSPFTRDASAYEAELRDQVSRLGGVFLGELDRTHLPSRLRQADITCVLSQVPEPFGLVVLEAMASGVAVVASRIGGLPEAAGDAAVLVDPADSDELDRALATLLASDLDLLARKRRGLDQAQAFSWPTIAGSFVSALQMMLVNDGST